MIDPSKLKILQNYVLVLPNPYFDTYQFNAKETGILTSSYSTDDKGNKVSTKEQHVAVSGTVYAIPEKLNYYGREIDYYLDKSDFWTIHGAKVRNRYDQAEIDQFRRDSVQFDVDIECRVGDKVYWEYLAQMFADQQGLWIDTIKGKMMLIKYDMLILAVRDEEIIPLNGFLIIENEKLEKQEIEHGIEGEILESGIILIASRTEKKTRVTCEATVIKKSGRCRGYLDKRGTKDAGFFTHPPNINWTNEDVEEGSKILYDPRMAKEVEFGLHRTLSEKRLLRIQRKDIYFLLK